MADSETEIVDERQCGKIILLVSGKRKCGKDYLSEKIQERLGTDASIVLRISAPLKEEYAEINNLNFERLLDPTEYKEKYRSAMVAWSEDKRRQDPGYFCQKAIQPGKDSRKPIWIIADIRRHTDLQFFEMFNNLKLRVTARDDIRVKRGWKFVKGIDDCETETNLDDYVGWDFIIENDGDEKQLEKQINQICIKLREFVNK